MPIRICVTGASGFIGRHVLQALLQFPVEITATTRNPARLDEFARQVSIIPLDLSRRVSGTFDVLGRPDVLLHLAWEGLPNYRSLRHFEVELPIQYNFLKGLISEGLKAAVVAGTCFEYGLQSGCLSEDLHCRPSTPYGFAKDALHRQLRYLQASQSFRLTWARLFYIYGEGQAVSSLWSQLQRALLQNEASFPMSAGDQLRDFLPVAELAKYLVTLTLLQTDAGAVNVCSGKPRSVRGLVEEWLAQSGKSIKLELGRYPYPDYEPMAFWGDDRRLRSLAG